MVPPGSLQRGLLQELASRLPEDGFKPRMKRQDFVREVPSGQWIVHVGFIRHPDDVDVTVDPAVRLEPVERLLEAAGYGHGQGATIGAELGNIVDGRPRRWTIQSAADCPVVAEEMASEIRKFALAWLERHSDPRAVFGILAQQDRQSWLYSPVHVKRCLTLVALATHLESDEKADEVARECRSFLQARNDPQLRVFDHHVRALLES
jgi:hypothetical protein